MICGPQIQTSSGRYFDLLNPDPNAFDLFDIAAALSKICRFTGHCSSFYSVAQHSVLVSFLVGPRLARWGLFHDAAEAFLGDVATPLKQLLPDYKAIEQRVEHVVWRKFGLEPPMPPEIKTADLVMLATEKRDLMPNVGGPAWAVLNGIAPLGNRIAPWSPDYAAEIFIERAIALTERQAA